MITTALSPNLERDDLWLSMQLLLQPWRWQRGQAEKKLLDTLRNYFQSEQLYVTNSGRTALLILLQALSLDSADEVLMQAFTCSAVCNPIQWAGAKPVYVDIDPNTFTLSVEDLTKKITAHSRVLIIQHTFGKPADLTPLLALAKQHQLFVIEDCAHALGARAQGKLLGTFGDAAIFSFGRDKVISSVYGGALLLTTPQSLPTLPYPSRWWTLQQLLHPLITTLSRFIPGVLRLAQKIHLISLAVSRAERHGQQPHYFPARLPNALATLALQQFRKLERFNQHRRKIARLYHDQLNPQLPWDPNSIYLRYSIRVTNPIEVLAAAKQANMILGDWYDAPIVPRPESLERFGYQAGSCPNAEAVAKQIVNLPTHPGITTHAAQQIIQFIQPYVA